VSFTFTHPFESCEKDLDLPLHFTGSLLPFTLHCLVAILIVIPFLGNSAKGVNEQGDKMPVKQINTELGHSLPPEAPHNITFHIPGWDTAKALRRGDPELLSKLASIYPRFGPWCEVREVRHLPTPFDHMTGQQVNHRISTTSAINRPPLTLRAAHNVWSHPLYEYAFPLRYSSQHNLSHP